MVWIKRTELEKMKLELKSFYQIEQDQQNEYLASTFRGITGMELAPFKQITRQQIKESYETIAPVKGVIDYIADNVGDLFRYLELTDKDGKSVEQHWILDLLNRPNDRFTARKFGQAWAVNKLLYGDAWVYAEKAIGKDKGRVKEMYVIPSHKVSPERGGSDIPFKGIKITGANYQGKLMTPDCFFESFDYNLDDTSFFGTSKIVTAALYLSVMERGINRQDTALRNGGVANIITPAKDNMGVMPKDADSLEKKFNSTENFGKTMALRLPIDVHTLGNTPVDLNILTSHKEAVTALCFVYKLPVDLYYGQAKYENAKEAKKAIYEQNAIPLVNEFAEDLIHYCGLDIEGYELKVNVDKIDILKDKAGDVLDNLGKMHSTLNELREAYGYERIEEAYADQPIMPMGVMFGNESYSMDEVSAE